MTKIRANHPTSASIELEGSGFGSHRGTMPRGDDCHRCGQPFLDHSDGKCLFDSCEAVGISREEFLSRFSVWVSGQSLEEALANIIYELTERG